MHPHSLHFLRHSAAKVLSYVLSEMLPNVVFLNSGATEHGFYCDFLADRTVDSHMLVLIQEKMRAAIKSDLPMGQVDMVRANAVELFRHHKQPHLAQQIATNAQQFASVLRIGDFYTLSDEAIVASTGELPAFTLTELKRIASEVECKSGQESIRILGLVAHNPQELKKSIKNLEALRENHTFRLAEEMKLFATHSDLSELEWCWYPNGQIVKESLLTFWKNEMNLRGYQLVSTPQFVKNSRGVEPTPEVDLSGEYEGTRYQLLSSLALSHIHLFKSFFADMSPIGLAECATVATSQSAILPESTTPPVSHADFAHYFCSLEEVEAVMISSLQFIDKMTRMFGFRSHWTIVGRGTKFSGTVAMWDQAMECAKRALQACGQEEHESKEETAFAGPKLQGYLIDAHGREWVGPSVSVDWHLPQKLQLPAAAIITTQVFGSLERFLSILIEHVRGELPLWLTPEQVRVVPISSNMGAYAATVASALREAGWRVRIDAREVSLGKRVHQAEQERVPYTVVVGEQEENTQTLSVRVRGSARNHMCKMTSVELCAEMDKAKLSKEENCFES